MVVYTVPFTPSGDAAKAQSPATGRLKPLRLFSTLLAITLTGLHFRVLLGEEISNNPYCSSNREGLGVFTPIRMIVAIRKNQRYPHE